MYIKVKKLDQTGVESELYIKIEDVKYLQETYNDVNGEKKLFRLYLNLGSCGMDVEGNSEELNAIVSEIVRPLPEVVHSEITRKDFDNLTHVVKGLIDSDTKIFDKFENLKGEIRSFLESQPGFEPVPGKKNQKM